ncbi:MAG: DUF4926 domain-containing protein [Candidatus Acidiferrum sp.]
MEGSSRRAARPCSSWTIVENPQPGVFDVEFCDDSGRTYASLAIHSHQLLVLHHDQTGVA